jgi:hypothetical protein
VKVTARVLAATVVAVAALTPAPASAATPSIVCTYKITITWLGGFMADLYIANQGTTAINGWNARWSMRTETSGLTAWSAVMTMPTPYSMTASNLPWNGTIPPGSVASFGWTARAASTEVPTDIVVNNQPC